MRSRSLSRSIILRRGRGCALSGIRARRNAFSHDAVGFSLCHSSVCIDLLSGWASHVPVRHGIAGAFWDGFTSMMGGVIHSLAVWRIPDVG